MHNYDVRFADLALPPAVREGRRARSLFTALEREGFASRFDELARFVRESRGESLDFTKDGLLGLDAWFRDEAPIAMVAPMRGQRSDEVMLTEIARALTVDVMIAVGELIRVDYPSAPWTLPRYTPGDDRRFLPEVRATLQGESVMYLASLKIYISISTIARARAGDVLNWVPAPVDRAFRAFDESVEKAKERAQESAPPPARTPPPIPAPSAAARERYRRAAAEGRLGGFEEILVIAPMSPDAARAVVENYSGLEDDEPPNPAVVQFVTELYKRWPWIESDDTMPSPWTDELYDCISGDFVSVSPSPEAVGAEVFTDVLEIAERLRMPVYSTETGDLLNP